MLSDVQMSCFREVAEDAKRAARCGCAGHRRNLDLSIGFARDAGLTEDEVLHALLSHEVIYARQTA